MNDKNESGKKAYRHPEVTSRKMTLGVYGSYGVDSGDSQPERRPAGDHRDWNSL